MHELPIITRIVDICTQHAERNKARKILTIELYVSLLSDLKPEWLQRYFDHVSKDTLAAGAQLKIEPLPMIYKCDKCGHEFAIEIQDGNVVAVTGCPECDSSEVKFVSGNGYRIGNMEIV